MTSCAWAVLAFYAALFLLSAAIAVTARVVRYCCDRARGRRLDREITAIISSLSEQEVRELWQR